MLPIEGIRIRRQERKKKDVEKEARKAITSLTPKNNFLLESGDGNDSIANPVDQAVRRADKRRQSDTWRSRRCAAPAKRRSASTSATQLWRHPRLPPPASLRQASGYSGFLFDSSSPSRRLVLISILNTVQ